MQRLHAAVRLVLNACSLRTGGRRMPMKGQCSGLDLEENGRKDETGEKMENRTQGPSASTKEWLQQSIPESSFSLVCSNHDCASLSIIEK